LFTVGSLVGTDSAVAETCFMSRSIVAASSATENLPDQAKIYWKDIGRVLYAA